MGVNLRAENGQNERAPWQVAIHSARSMHTNELSRLCIARPTRTVTLWARKDSDGDKGTDEKDVENHEQEAQYLGAASCSTAEL